MRELIVFDEVERRVEEVVDLKALIVFDEVYREVEEGVELKAFIGMIRF